MWTVLLIKFIPPGSCGYAVNRNEQEIKEAIENFVMALNRTKVGFFFFFSILIFIKRG